MNPFPLVKATVLPKSFLPTMLLKLTKVQKLLKVNFNNYLNNRDGQKKKLQGET